jgi:hypothetical protein
MNWIKKILLLLALLPSSSYTADIDKELYNALSALQSEKIRKKYRDLKLTDPYTLSTALLSAQIPIYAKDNLITEEITPKDSKSWNEAIASLWNFIKQKPPKAVLGQLQAFAQLQNIDNDIQKTLHDVFNRYVLPLLTDDKSEGVKLQRAWMIPDPKAKPGENKYTKHAAAIAKAKQELDWGNLNIQAIKQQVDALHNRHYKTVADLIPTFKASNNKKPDEANTLLWYYASSLELVLTRLYTSDLNHIKTFINTFIKSGKKS